MEEGTYVVIVYDGFGRLVVMAQTDDQTTAEKYFAEDNSFERDKDKYLLKVLKTREC